VEVGEMVEVEIKKSRFQVNDEYILSVGLFKSRSRGVKKNVYATNEDDGDDETAEERTDGGDDTTTYGDADGAVAGVGDVEDTTEQGVVDEGADEDVDESKYAESEEEGKEE